MNTQTRRKVCADREAKQALWDAAYLSVWAARPSLGQSDGLGEAGRCQGSVARGHGTQLRDEDMEGESCVSSNEKCITSPTKGATTGSLCVSVCVCVCVCVFTSFNNLICFQQDASLSVFL